MARRDLLPISLTQRVRDACVCFHMQRAARALARRFDEAFRPLNLTNQQFTLLLSINRVESRAVGEAARLLDMDRTTLTAALKPLARRGLVAVEADAEDKRSRKISITPAGRALLGEALPLWRRTHAAVERQIPSADRLRADLRALGQTSGGGADEVSVDRRRRRRRGRWRGVDPCREPAR
jgi:DNA-binding MarR family transcriptional regulator